ncbi:hypothetical protein BVRB_3g053920 [Beta vulgaris subsp. vulgaris]|nr:hypothetical protein BVRB_3g053920 [Beta vulgaris subsp. vulgaris]
MVSVSSSCRRRCRCRAGPAICWHSAIMKSNSEGQGMWSFRTKAYHDCSTISSQYKSHSQCHLNGINSNNY